MLDNFCGGSTCVSNSTTHSWMEADWLIARQAGMARRTKRWRRRLERPMTSRPQRMKRASASKRRQWLLVLDCVELLEEGGDHTAAAPGVLQPDGAMVYLIFY